MTLPFGPEAPGSIRRRRRPGFHQPPGLSANARRVLVPFIARLRDVGGVCGEGRDASSACPGREPRPFLGESLHPGTVTSRKGRRCGMASLGDEASPKTARYDAPRWHSGLRVQLLPGLAIKRALAAPRRVRIPSTARPAGSGSAGSADRSPSARRGGTWTRGGSGRSANAGTSRTDQAVGQSRGDPRQGVGRPMAERVGFEPTKSLDSALFKSAAINRSATSPAASVAAAMQRPPGLP